MRIDDPRLYLQEEVGDKGAGIFAKSGIARGDVVITMSGIVRKTSELDDDMFALQIDEDLWLTSYGDHVDDYINHSCDANTGFIKGDTRLIALRDILEGEEITFDYSTAMSDPEWSLDCLCGTEECRGVVLPFPQLEQKTRKELGERTLLYLRKAQ